VAKRVRVGTAQNGTEVGHTLKQIPLRFNMQANGGKRNREVLLFWRTVHEPLTFTDPVDEEAPEVVGKSAS